MSTGLPTPPRQAETIAAISSLHKTLLEPPYLAGRPNIARLEEEAVVALGKMGKVSVHPSLVFALLGGRIRWPFAVPPLRGWGVCATPWPWDRWCEG